MIQTIRYKIAGLLKRDDLRSQTVLRNILMSFGVKGGSILVGLMLVPMTISYINPVQYGIWLTISSIVGWMNFFDIGMGNGLRNKLTAALALKEYDEAKKYVSTTYATLTIIAVGIFILFWLTSSLFNWRTFLNVPPSIDTDIQSVLLIVVGAFCFQFVAQLLNTILTATHEPAIAGFISFIGQVCLLIAVFILKHTVKGSLELLVAILSLVPAGVLLIVGAILYSSKLRSIAPSIKNIDFSYTKNILNIGGIFFFIQIGTLILFQTDNIIIAKVIGPEAVTTFGVTYKLFSVVTMLFSIVMTPYWSAFTDAYTKKDFAWMQHSMNRLRKVWYAVAFICIPLLVVLSGTIFKLWLHDTVSIPFRLSALMGVYAICFTCLSLNCFFLNGVGKLRIQLLLYIIVSILNIPLGVYLGQNFGIEGVVTSNIILFLFMTVTFWIQVNKILASKATGLWNS